MTVIMPWEHADPLTEALYQVRMRGAFYSWTEASGPGSVEMPQLPDTLTFHIVARGTAYLEVDGEDAVALPAGQLALVPRGIGHRVSTAPHAPLLGRADLLPQTMLGESFSILRFGPADDRGTASPALRRGRLRLVRRQRCARGAAADHPRRLGRPPDDGGAAAAAGRRAAGAASRRRRRRDAARRRARGGDGARLARRAGGRGDGMAGGSPRSSARPGDRGGAPHPRVPLDPRRRWPRARRCRGRGSPRVSPTWSARRR